MGATVSYLRESHGLRAAGLDLSRKLLAQSMPSMPRIRARAEILPVASRCLDGLVCECAAVAGYANPLTNLVRVLSCSGSRRFDYPQ